MLPGARQELHKRLLNETSASIWVCREIYLRWAQHPFNHPLALIEFLLKGKADFIFRKVMGR